MILNVPWKHPSGFRVKGAVGGDKSRKGQSLYLKSSHIAVVQASEDGVLAKEEGMEMELALPTALNNGIV